MFNVFDSDVARAYGPLLAKYFVLPAPSRKNDYGFVASSLDGTP